MKLKRDGVLLLVLEMLFLQLLVRVRPQIFSRNINLTNLITLLTLTS